MGILTDLLEPVGRFGRGVAGGLGAAGRDVLGQMTGSTGPTNSRWQNIGINAANPLGIAQTGQAFADGFSNGYGSGQMPSGTFDRAQGAISSRAGSGTRPVGSVVGRGFVGDGRGNAAVQRGPSERAPLDAFGGTLGGLLSQGGTQPYQMPGTNTGSRLDAFGNTLDETLAANEAPAGQPSGSRPRGSVPLGAGQLGSAGDAALRNNMAAFLSRGGTQVER